MSTRRRNFFLLLAGFWLASLVGGFAALQAYAGRAGRLGDPGPDASDWLESHRRPGRPLVVMAVHARCPCTDASLAELGDFLARTQGACDALLLRYSPGVTESENPLETRVLGGVTVPLVADPTGRLAADLGAFTSGSIVMMDAAGRIRFHGGLTLERGHRGRSPAQDAMLALVEKPADATLAVAPVYGCPLPEQIAFARPEVCQ
jgi:hypothetical protein